MKARYASPVGELVLEASEGKLIALAFDGEEDDVFTRQDALVLDDTKRQLDAYFAKGTTTFTLPLAPRGTTFQTQVWKALCDIPSGETKSYGAIATSLGKPKAFRAVGGANHVNPIAIIIPCHRVIGASGKLVGYAGGLHRKEWLLGHEAKQRVFVSM